jgi:hypothetical protein
LCVCLYSGDWLLGTKSQVDADTKKDVKSIRPEEQAEHDENTDAAKKKRSRAGFRNRKVACIANCLDYVIKVKPYISTGLINVFSSIAC